MAPWRDVVLVVVLLALALALLCALAYGWGRRAALAGLAAAALSSRSAAGASGARWGGARWGSGRSPDGGRGFARGGELRGAAVDRAAALDPGALLDAEWPAPGDDLQLLEVRLEPAGRGGGPGRLVVCGPQAASPSPCPVLLAQNEASNIRFDRMTLASPENIALAARDTLARRYAWVLFDSHEGRWAVRADPARAAPDGMAKRLGAAVAAALEGTSPHKMPAKRYAEILRAEGLEVAHRPRLPDQAVRFNAYRLRPKAERLRYEALLRGLACEDWAAADWAEFDRAALPLLRQPHESGGILEVSRRGDGRLAVAAPRTYPGSMAETFPALYGAPARFHVHPHGRGRIEIPSETDLDGQALRAAYGQLDLWEIVLAPEGKYIIGVTDGLLALARADREALEGSVSAALDRAAGRAGRPADAPAAIRELLAALAAVGFRACFVPNPPEFSQPFDQPWNLVDYGERETRLAELAARAPGEVLGTDWGVIDRALEATPRSRPTAVLVLLEKAGPRILDSASFDPEEAPAIPDGPADVLVVFRPGAPGVRGPDLAAFEALAGPGGPAWLVATSGAGGERWAVGRPLEGAPVAIADLGGLGVLPEDLLRGAGYRVARGPVAASASGASVPDVGPGEPNSGPKRGPVGRRVKGSGAGGPDAEDGESGYEP
jgi:hypothetical protein